ncbi:MAG: hypothetical protein IPG00_15675 [Saprospiraceae bacterium]|nr:hypothetical protein [Saprospiraceae bacterium]
MLATFIPKVVGGGSGEWLDGKLHWEKQSDKDNHFNLGHISGHYHLLVDLRTLVLLPFSYLFWGFG